MKNKIIIIGAGILAVIVVILIYPNTEKAELKKPALVAGVKTEISPSFSVIAVGDIMLGRAVETLINKYGGNYPFEKIGEVLKSVDFAIGNLEGPIIYEHTQTPNGSFTFSFMPAVAEVLRSNNFTFLTLGNNHTYDRGISGLEETRKHLENSSITPVGHPSSADRQYAVNFPINGKELIFVSFNATYSISEKEALGSIRSLKNEKPDSFIIVFIHWGEEYKLLHNSTQENLGHKIIDAGADLIVGAHPHVVQDIEEYNGKLIFYSLGNFIFDQYFSKNVQQGLMVKINFFDSEVEYQLIPIHSVKSQPMVMDNISAKEWLIKLSSRSDEALVDQIQNGLIISK